MILRLFGYPVIFDQVLNLIGLLNLTIGLAILLFNWLVVAVHLHTNAVYIGMAHLLISDGLQRSKLPPGWERVASAKITSQRPVTLLKP